MISKVRLCLPWTKQVFTIPRYCSPVSAAKSYTTSEGVKDNVIPIPKSADVVIIGGGVIGCSVLYHLTKLGVTNCVLIEKDQLTAGTTWHTNGLVWRLRPNDTDVQLLARSRDLMKSLEAETGVSTGWIENGGMFIASDKERLEEYKQMMSLGKYFGIESHILSPEETKKAFPLMNTEDLYGVLFSPGDGIIDPTGYCTAMARAANQAGAKIITDSYVTDVNVSEDDFGVKRVVSVETSSGKVQTNKVVNCTGVWAPLIGQMAGVKTPLVAMKHAHVVTEKIEGIRNMPNVRDHDASMCLKVQGDTVSIGGYEPNPLFWDDVKKDFAFTLFDLDWDVFGVSIDGAANRVPVVGETGIKATVCGPESFTPDHKPLLGESPEVRGFYHGCGFNSSGMMLSGGCGQQLAEWVAHGSPSLDMYNYDIRRFTEKLTGNQSWMRQRSHEAYATNYSTVFIHDEPLASRNMRLDPLYEELASAGCHYQERQGWERPGWFSDQGPVKPPPYDWYGAYGHPVNQNNSYYDLLKNDYTFSFPAHHDVIGRECLSCRNNVAVFNMSYFGKFYLTGPDAQKAADWIFSNDVQKPPGSAVYTCMLNKFGGIESDMTVCVIEPGDGKPHSPTFEGRGFYISVSGATTQHNLSHIINVLQDEKFDCELLDVSEDMGMLSVQGPKSRDVIQALTDGDLSNDAFPFSTNKILSVAGHEVRAVRHSFVGELGWDLLIPKDECVDVYRAVMAEGEQHSIVNAGYRAFDSLSIEKGYRQWHADIRPDDSPLEAGLLHTCKLKTNTSFLGREAVERMQAEGVKKRLACFSIDEHVPLFGLEAIFRDNQVVGYLRRGEYAFSLGQSLGYGYVTHPEGQTVSMDFLKSGEFTIERMGTAYPAALHTKSPFDPKDLRVQGVYTR